MHLAKGQQLVRSMRTSSLPCRASLHSCTSLRLPNYPPHHQLQQARSASIIISSRPQKRRDVGVSAVAPAAAPPREQVFTSDPANNVSDYVYEKMGMLLHQQKDHPICIIKQVATDSWM